MFAKIVKMKIGIGILLLVIAFLIPMIFASSNYSSDLYGSGFYGRGDNETTYSEEPFISSSSGSSGSGGTPAVEKKPEIIIDTSEFNINMVVNTNQKKTITISNTGNVSTIVNLSKLNLGENLFFDESPFELAPGESKKLDLIFIALNKTGVFTGKIKIGNKEVLVSLNVRTKLLLFDSQIAVLNQDLIVKRGEKLITIISLIPMGEKERLDVTLEYEIKDYEGKVYQTFSETLLIEERMTINREFNLGMIPEGDYVVALNLVYPNGVAPSSAHFSVKGTSIIRLIYNSIYTYIVLGIIGLILLILIIRDLFRHGTKKEKTRRKVRNKKIKIKKLPKKKIYSKIEREIGRI